MRRLTQYTGARHPLPGAPLALALPLNPRHTGPGWCPTHGSDPLHASGERWTSGSTQRVGPDSVALAVGTQKHPPPGNAVIDYMFACSRGHAVRRPHSSPQGTARIAALLSVLMVLPASPGLAAQAPGFAEITTPAPGESLTGMVTVAGSANHPAFVSYDLAFAYATDVTGTWFPLAEAVTTPVRDGPLALWDTRSLSDEVYVLRLQVLLDDGSLLEATVGDLQVSNYTPTRLPQANPASTQAPTVTPLNPPPATAELGAAPPAPPPAEQIVLSWLRFGMATGAIGLLAVGVLVLGRRAWRWGQASIPRRRPRRRRRRRSKVE